MDPHVFDHLTRLVFAPRSRRAAWRALLAGALLEATTRAATAAPCANGKHECGEECCPGKCFVDDAGLCPVCCTGNNIICEDPMTGKSICCLRNDLSKDPCATCALPENPDPTCQPEFIAGSYRRR
jgi:hypothetical protein